MRTANSSSPAFKAEEAQLKILFTEQYRYAPEVPYLITIEQFALADFLVRENLSAVVDIGENYFGDTVDDPHHSDLLGHFKAMLFFSSYQELMKSLDGMDSGNPGETLLDAAHLVFHTEMDRTPWVIGETNHSEGGTTSIVMAGYGIRGGRIIGDLHKGARDEAAFGQKPHTSALPIDLTNGAPKAGGNYVSLKSLAPAIVAMFDAVLPANQISDESAVMAVIKKKM